MDDTELGVLLEHTMRSPKGKGMLDCAGLGYKRGTSASTRTIENAFRSFLEHKQDSCVLPNDFLRRTGRRRELPKRGKPLPQLHVLADTMPVELNKALYQQCPQGLNVVFYETKGYLHPSRDFNFQRVHPPNTRLDLGGTVRLEADTDGGKLQRMAERVRPLTTGSVERSSRRMRGQAAGASAAARLHSLREQRRAGEFLASHVESFEVMHGLAAATSPHYRKSETAADESSDDEDGRHHRIDPCQDASGIARLVFVMQRIKKTCVKQLVNRMSVIEAKKMFSDNNTSLADFVSNFGRVFRGQDKRRPQGLKALFSLLLTAPFRPDSVVDGKLQKETWQLVCHYMWRAHRGDREALLKAAQMFLDMRGSGVNVSEVQLLVAAYRSKRNHSVVVLREIEAVLLQGLVWEHGRVPYSVWNKAVVGSDVLRSAMLGPCDSTVNIAA